MSDKAKLALVFLLISPFVALLIYGVALWIMT